MHSIMHGPDLWYATRATGLVTLFLITASVLLGLLTAGRFASERWPRFVTIGLHRNLSLMSIIFLAIHVITTIIDSYTSIPLVAAFIPFTTSYKENWVALGAIACDLMIALVVTSLLRNRMGHRTWRVTHWLAYACWPVALAHGLGTGTDHKTIWVVALTIVCVAFVAATATWRVVAAARAGAR
jgi:predicted ferric reductase